MVAGITGQVVEGITQGQGRRRVGLDGCNKMEAVPVTISQWKGALV